MPGPEAYQKLRERRGAVGALDTADDECVCLTAPFLPPYDHHDRATHRVGGRNHLVTFEPALTESARACVLARSSGDSDSDDGPRCVVLVTHGGQPHRIELSGTVGSLTFLNVLQALRHVRAGMPKDSAAKLVYRGKICAPDMTLADAGIAEGASPKMVLIAAQQRPAAAAAAEAPRAGACRAAGAESEPSTDGASGRSADASQILGEGIRRWTTTEANPAAKEEGEAVPAPAPAPARAESAPPDAIALYDFNPQHARQMKLSAGDLLDVLRSEADDWWLVRPYGWTAEGGDRAAGWVPSAYISTRPGWQRPVATTARSAEALDSGGGGGSAERDAAIKELMERYARERRELASDLPRKEAVYGHVAQYAHADGTHYTHIRTAQQTDSRKLRNGCLV